MQSGSRVVKGRCGCYRGMEHFVGQLEIEGFVPALWPGCEHLAVDGSAHTEG